MIPIPRQRPAFPQLAVLCPWCHSAPGELCTSHRGRRARRDDTHTARRTAWAINTATCPTAGCEAAPGSPCRSATTGLQLTTGVHAARDAAAERAATCTTHQPPLPANVTDLTTHRRNRGH
ncbi:hypothetical protein AB0A77_28480 [Streptomyces varsoviensis]|uniref:zinc finger domain-containing protein n=1 Tax=Streptomyces varsoviensis TaxID=67373 RepID=UPI0033FA718B